jgi:hypothetical protein
MIALLAVLGAGCTTMAADEPVHGETPGYECKSEGLDAFVGREPTSEVGSEILSKSGAKVFRWLVPGQIVTMEFRSDRVNAHIGTNNRIERVTCG